MFESHYRRIVRASAFYDLIVTAPFATPWAFAWVLEGLRLFGPMPEFAPEHMLFANLLGSIVVVWSLLRLRDPQPIYGLFDSFGRALFFTWQIYYLVNFDITPAVWLFAFFEFAWLVVQGYGYWLLRKVESKEPSGCRVVGYFRVVGV